MYNHILFLSHTLCIDFFLQTMTWQDTWQRRRSPIPVWLGLRSAKNTSVILLHQNLTKLEEQVSENPIIFFNSLFTRKSKPWNLRKGIKFPCNVEFFTGRREFTVKNVIMYLHFFILMCSASRSVREVCWGAEQCTRGSYISTHWVWR